MSITPLRFTGVSSFSDDFQSVVDRAVSIASLPIIELQNDQVDLLSKKTLLGSLNSAVSELAGRLESLRDIGSSKAINATSSDSSRVTVTTSSGATPGIYTITDIDSVATAAATMSLSGYAAADSTAVSSDGTLELVVGHKNYTIDLTADVKNTLNGLRDEINGLGAGVTATVINTGTGETPYYLSLSSNSTGQKALELRETAAQASTNLLENSPVTSEAVYTSNAGYATRAATSVSADGTMQFVVGDVKHTLDLTGANNLEGLRDAINALAAGVTATILDTGGTTDRYRLSLSAAGGEAVQLEEVPDDASSNILTNAHLGSDASFKLNGLRISKSDNTVSGLVPGVNFRILDETSGGQQVVVSLASNRSTLGTAINGLATAYNAIVDAVNAQIGEDAGLLSGDSILREVQSQLRALTTYQGSGSIDSLFDLGVELDSSGKMSFDTDVFYSLPDSDITAAFDFLNGSGFEQIYQSIPRISDPVTGLIQLEQDRYDETDLRLQEQIALLTERVDVMQENLLFQLQQADVLLASLASQQDMLDASINGLNLVLFGKQDG